MPLDTPHILTTTAQPTAVLHLTSPRDQIRAVMGPGRQEVAALLQAQGVTPTGPWFSRHFAMHPDTFDFEIGMPVARAIEPAGRVHNSELPATRVVRTNYRGGHEGLGQAWGEFLQWIEAQGLEMAPGLWEVYVHGGEDGAVPVTELTRMLRG
jgi:effector-binding domain-containing protein